MSSQKPNAELPRIQITDKMVGKLMKKYDTSDVTVRLSLRFANNSDLARAIRKTAVELMEEAVKSNKAYMKQYN